MVNRAATARRSGLPGPRRGSRVAVSTRRGRAWSGRMPRRCSRSSRAVSPVRAGLTAYELRAHLRGILPDHALPRRAVTAGAVPTRGPGKPDRRAVVAMFTMG